MRDAAAKGRTVAPLLKGSAHGMAKLTEGCVRNILVSSESAKTLAARLGVQNNGERCSSQKDVETRSGSAMNRWIRIHLLSDGSYSLRTQGVDAHRVRNILRLTGRCPEKIRSYCHVALNVVPEVVGRPKSVPPSPPPSGPMVAGD